MWFNSKEREEEKGLFTRVWMQTWFENINNSKEYKQKAKNWNAPLIIKFEPLPEIFSNNKATGIFLNLKYGECNELRYSTENDEDSCDVILSANEKTWIQLMKKGADPTSMILNKQLSLEKGSLILLSTQRKAAKALLKTAPTLSVKPNSNNEIIKPKNRTHFKTTRAGLNDESLPLKLFKISGDYGYLLSGNIDQSKDKYDWSELDEEEQIFITHFMSLLIGCKEASSIFHLPLVQIVADEGRIEEQMFFSSLLWDESNHLEFLSNYSKRVIGFKQNFELYHGDHFKNLFFQKLSHSVNLLKTNPTPALQIKISATLNIIVKDMITKSCCKVLKTVLIEQDILPGLKITLTRIIQKESVHQTFALYFIKRLLNKNNNLMGILEKELDQLLNDGTNVIQEIFTFYEDEIPFGVKRKPILVKAIKSYQQYTSALELS